MTATGARSPAAEDPPPELVARFREALDRLWPEGGRLGLAVSGGPDSMAMLLLAQAAIPGKFEVATVDHGLRPEAAEECVLVQRACRKRGVPCQALTVTVGRGNLQNEARAARYAALGNWAADHGLSALATAHHADDQAETLVMRLNRGSGLAGLAGVREVGWLEDFDAFVLIRPLLTFRRFELRSVVDRAGESFAQDSSNDDATFDRVRVRKALDEADWLDPRAWAKSAAHLAEAEEAMNFLAHQAWVEGAIREGDMIRVKYNGWRAVQRRLLERAIRELGGAPRGSDVDRLLNRLEFGQGGNLAGVLVTAEHDAGTGATWVFRPEPPRRTG